MQQLQDLNKLMLVVAKDVLYEVLFWLDRDLAHTDRIHTPMTVKCPARSVGAGESYSASIDDILKPLLPFCTRNPHV